MKKTFGRIARHWALKSIAFLLVVLTFSASVFFAIHFTTGAGSTDIILQSNYMRTQSEGQVRNIYYNFVTILRYESEEWIQSEEFLAQVKNEIQIEMQNQEFEDQAQEWPPPEEPEAVAPPEEPQAPPGVTQSEAAVASSEQAAAPPEETEEQVRDSATTTSTAQTTPQRRYYEGHGYLTDEEWIAVEAEVRVQDALRYFRYAENNLRELKGIYYHLHAPTKEQVRSNTSMTMPPEEIFAEFQHHFIFMPEEGPPISDFWDDELWKLDPAAVIYIGFSDEYVAEQQALFEGEKQQAMQELVRLLLVVLVGVMGVIYLIVVTGKKSDGSFRLHVIDKLWTDVNLVVLGMVTFVYMLFAKEVYSRLWIMAPNNNLDEITWVAWLYALLTIPYMIIALGLFLSLVRHLKNRTLLRHSLIGAIFRITGRVFGTIFSAVRTRSKVIQLFMLAIGITGILTLLFAEFLHFGGGGAMFFVFFFWLVLMVGILYVLLKYVLLPYDQAVEAKIDSAVSQQMKAEKMKLELITNVSHDLKTPLTAIINYADLLLKKDPKNEYAGIIYDKSLSLKSMTEDLFEVSKAQSGNLNLTLEELNVAELIEQSLAEFDDHTVVFKQNIADLTIHADGKLMSRAFENLIGNILKYALPGTRAYIDVYEQQAERGQILEPENEVVIVFKNIAQYEMNFDASEISERFTRGDASRSTEGNGLGLAIAKSYVEVCGGKLAIDIDGDLFKVTMTF